MGHNFYVFYRKQNGRYKQRPYYNLDNKIAEFLLFV